MVKTVYIIALMFTNRHILTAEIISFWNCHLNKKRIINKKCTSFIVASSFYTIKHSFIFKMTSQIVQITSWNHANSYQDQKTSKHNFCMTTRVILRGKFYWKCQICYFKCVESAMMKRHILRKHKPKKVTFNV